MKDLIQTLLFGASHHSRAPIRYSLEDSRFLLQGSASLPRPQSHRSVLPGYIVRWLHPEEGEECPNAIVNLGSGWKTRLKLLISRLKGQGSRQGGWKQSGLRGQQRTVKAEVPSTAEHQLSSRDVPPSLGSSALPVWPSV